MNKVPRGNVPGGPDCKRACSVREREGYPVLFEYDEEDPMTKEISDTVCVVCGKYWNDHGLGGNCKHPRLDVPDEQDIKSVLNPR